MESFARVRARFNDGPFLGRLTAVGLTRLSAVAAIGVPVLIMLHVGHFTLAEKILLWAIVATGLFKIGSRPYWLIWGIVIGAGLVDALPRLHSILGH